jgi:hypothetical protein
MAPSVAGHLDVHITFYRYTKEEDGRVWFTWDGTEVAGFDDATFWWRVLPLSAELKDAGQEVDDAWERAVKTAQLEGKTDVSRFSESVDDYLSLPIGAAIASGDPVVRGLAVLDRRAGMRTLLSSRIAAERHPFVRRMADLRLEAEGWASRLTSSGDISRTPHE